MKYGKKNQGQENVITGGPCSRFLRIPSLLAWRKATAINSHQQPLMALGWSAWPLRFAAACICQVVGGNLISPTTSSLLTTICSKKIYGRALGVLAFRNGCKRRDVARVVDASEKRGDGRRWFHVLPQVTVVEVDSSNHRQFVATQQLIGQRGGSPPCN